MAQRLRILLHGSYYTNNFGDILLMLLNKRWLEEYSRLVDVRIPFLNETLGAQPVPRSKKWREVFTSDALVLGGGGYFSEPAVDPQRWGLRLLSRYATVAAAHRLRRIPYAVVGVSVGPISNVAARNAVKRVFEGAKVASVRDAESLHFLREYGVRSHVEVTADAALAVVEPNTLTLPRNNADSAFDRPTIAVHLSYSSTHDEIFRQLIAAIIDRLSDEPVGVLAITDQVGAISQLEAAEELKRGLGSKCCIVPYSDPWTLTNLLGRVSGVITTKLHVGIVAVAQGRSVLSFPTHTKTPRFYSQVGRTHRCFPLYTGRDTVDLAAIIEEWLATRDKDPPVPQSAMQAAVRNRTLLQEFIDAILSARSNFK